MATKRMSGGLGRGLGALIPQKAPEEKAVSSPASSVAPEEKTGFRQIRVDAIVPNPEQPRAVFKHKELEDLMHSIKEHGVLQPLTVTDIGDGKYELIAGERRYRASKMVGLETVPAIVREDAGLNDKLVLALIENIQREDLSPLEEAKGYQRLSTEFSLTQEEISQRVGKARSTVANMMRLLDLPTEVQDAIAAGIVPAGSARAMLALPDEASQLEFFRKLVAAGSMSTRDVEAGVRRASGKPSRKDPALAADEDALRAALGARVEVKKKNGQGMIMISFYSDDEYEEIKSNLSA